MCQRTDPEIIRAVALEAPMDESLRKVYPSPMTYFVASDMVSVTC